MNVQAQGKGMGKETGYSLVYDRDSLAIKSKSENMLAIIKIRRKIITDFLSHATAPFSFGQA